MTIQEYQNKAVSTLNTKLSTEERMLLVALGLAGETGEAVDIIKKVQYGGKQFDKEHFIRELGDILWYIALAADTLEIPLEQIFQTNIDKLSQRYPNGWNEYNANHRKDGDI